MDAPRIEEFVADLRRWDEQAVRRLVALLEPGLARMVRIRLGEAGLNRVADTEDVCQSVFVRFLNHANAGDFTITSFEQLRNLLTTMAVNRVRDLRRKGGAAARGGGPDAAPEVAGAFEPADDSSTPSQHMALQDLLQEMYRRLSKGASQVHQWRAAGMSWIEIAEQLGEPPQAVRVRFAREIQRVARELGVNEPE